MYSDVMYSDVMYSDVMYSDVMQERNAERCDVQQAVKPIFIGFSAI
jgi:hypothetical protein